MTTHHEHHDHCQHTHEHHNHDHCQHIHPVTSNLKIAFLLNLSFTILELAGGFLTNSMAILSDAIHDFGDTFAIGSALFLERYAAKGRDSMFSYGYKRLSTLSALINSILLLSGSCIIIYETIPRLLAPESVHAQGMFYLAVLGILMNGLAVLRLRKSHQNNMNQRVLMLHLLEDVLGWMAILAGSIVMMWVDWPIIDPILSMSIALFILWNVFKNLKPILRIFLQAIPKNINLTQIQQELQHLEQVVDIHEVHAWSLDGEEVIMTLHIIVEDHLSIEEVQKVKQQVRQTLTGFHISHITIEVNMKNELYALANIT